jgi:acetoin utilization deacetylase AcuC-like enzyme
VKFPIIYSPEFLEHQTGRAHPESPARLTAIVAALKSAVFADRLDCLLPTPVDQRPGLMTLLGQIHTQDHIDRVRRMADSGGGMLDPDTIVSPRSYEVALLAVSAWLDGIDRVLNTGKPAFVLARPPGHHAEADRGMGFCLFANAAIAAYYALQQPRIERVAILDWDVHHGNGTQAIVQSHPQICYCSLHQSPCYPGTGMATEQGYYQNVLNLPLPPGSSGVEYQQVFRDRVVPFISQWQPDILIVSAGYDALREDPLASMQLNSIDYAKFVKNSLQIGGKILFGLEGGYDLTALATAVAATIESCLTSVPE